MPNIVNTASGQRVELAITPFQTGGEGELYRIISPQSLSNYCVKICYQQYQNSQKEDKLKYMVSHKPQSLTDGSNFRICWATDIVYRQDDFVGFIMPLAFDNGIQLYELCTLKVRKNIDPIWHQKFDRSQYNTLPNRLKLCVNIAIAIHNIHSSKNYVLVDMKPQNMLVTADGKVSIVDLDSCQIAENGNVIYQGHVATPEYAPPERDRLNPTSNFIPENWDRFSLAIIFYELLFGLHPFVATSTGIYENITTIDESIQKGLFVFGSKSQYLQLPNLHNNFKILPQKLKDFFINALDKGHNNPNIRPSAKEWGEIIFSEINPTNTTQVASSNNNQPQIIYRQVEKIVEKIVYRENSWHLPMAIVAGILAIMSFFFHEETKRKLEHTQFEKQETTWRYEQLLVLDEQKTKLITKLSGGKPFIVQSIDFENSADRNNYKNSFVYNEVKYISPRIKIVALENISNANIFVKYFSPYGYLSRNSDRSPNGYSFSFSENISENTSEINGSGWGSNEGGSYEIGKHKVEIWYNNNLVGISEFTITE